MKNQIDSAETVEFTNGATAVVSGELVNLGNGLIGIAVANIAANATGVVSISGKYSLPKGTTAAIARGAVLKLGTAGNTVVIASAGTTVAAILRARVTKASTTAETTVEAILSL